MWRWRRPPGVASNFHVWPEDHYEGMGGHNRSKQLEYTIPGLNIRPDMFNSVIGDVYEIEPIYKIQAAFPEALGYVLALNFARANNRLQGLGPNGQRYNWRNTSFHVGTGVDWPGQYRRQIAGGQATYVADYVGPGTVVYWLEVPDPRMVPLPLRVHDKRLIKPLNYNPRLAWQPAYVVSGSDVAAACGKAVVFIGGAIIVVTVFEDVATAGLGTFDDAVTVPAGIWLIKIGQRIAAFVPVATTPVMNPAY